MARCTGDFPLPDFIVFILFYFVLFCFIICISLWSFFFFFLSVQLIAFHVTKHHSELTSSDLSDTPDINYNNPPA